MELIIPAALEMVVKLRGDRVADREFCGIRNTFYFALHVADECETSRSLIRTPM